MLTRSHAHLSRVVTLRCPAALLPRVDYHVLRYPCRSGWPRRTLDELLFQSSTSYVHHSKDFSFRQGGRRQLAPHSRLLHRFFNTHFHIILAEQRSSSRTESDTQSMRRTRRTLRLRIRFDPVKCHDSLAPRRAELCCVPTSTPSTCAEGHDTRARLQVAARRLLRSNEGRTHRHDVVKF